MKIRDLIKEDIKKLKEQDDDNILSKMSGPLTPDELAALRAAPMSPGNMAVDPSDPEAMAGFEKQMAQQQQQQATQQTQQYLDPSSPEHQQWAQSAQRHQALPTQPTIPGSSFTVSADQMRQMTPDQWAALLPPNLQPRQPTGNTAVTKVVPQQPGTTSTTDVTTPGTPNAMKKKQVAASRNPSLKEVLAQAIKIQRSK